MFSTSTFADRRRALRAAMGDATILLIGHRMVPRNYPHNTYPFRQNSHVLYYCGISRPDVALVMGPDGDALFGPPEDIDDVVWHGPHETLEEASAKAGISDVRDVAGLSEWLRGASDVRYIQPYQDNVINWMADLWGKSSSEVSSGQCDRLAAQICAQRSVKTEEELAEIEEALSVTRAMHLASYRATRPGAKESDIAAAVQQVAAVDPVRHGAEPEQTLTLPDSDEQLAIALEYGMLADFDVILNLELLESLDELATVESM